MANQFKVRLFYSRHVQKFDPRADCAPEIGNLIHAARIWITRAKESARVCSFVAPRRISHSRSQGANGSNIGPFK